MFTLLTFLSFTFLLHSTYSQSNDPSELLIWSCSSNGVNTYYYDPAIITYYAQTATEIIIRSNLDPNTWVKTTNDSYALDSLRLGKSLSYTANGGYAIPSGWTGPMSANMWNTCGQTDSFVVSPYWSCNNVQGLHLRPDFCGWSSSTGTPGGISIYIKRNLGASIPIWRCYSNGVNVPLVKTVSALNAIALQTSAITIYSTTRPQEYVKTSSPQSYAIQSLANGGTLSYTSAGAYAVVTDWVGSSAISASAKLWNSCGSNQGFISTPYWACNNGEGLHLTPQSCGWTSSGNTAGGITVAVTPNKPDPYRLVRIWYCGGGSPNTAVYDINTIKKLAKYATGITIMSRTNPEEYITTKSSSAYALTSLINGKTLSYTNAGGYAVVNDWVGTKTTNVWNSCGADQGFISTPYWACNNVDGLHLTPTSCGWTSSTNTAGGIGVYLHFPVGFTASLQLAGILSESEGDGFAHPTTVTHQSNGYSQQFIIGASVGGSAAFVVVVIAIVVMVNIIKKKQHQNESLNDYLIASL